MEIMIEHLRKLFAYDDWANREVLASLKAIDEPPPRSVKWLAHIIAAEVLWLARLKREESAMPVWPDLTISECESHIDRLAGLWSEFLRGLSDESLTERVSYLNSKGEEWTSKVEDVLNHVVMHSAYHRGQIASDVRASGHAPAYTDYIHATRQKIIE